jgi:cystathionine beta-lyase
MGHDFDRVIHRRGTSCVKYDLAEVNGYGADVLPMWVADMDFQAPECVRKALSDAIEYGIFGYGCVMDDYYQAVAGWFSKRFGWEVEKNWMIMTPGVVFALAAAVRVATEPGDAVLVQPPVYYPFYNVIRQNDRRLVESGLVYSDGKYTIDFEDLERKIVTEQVKLFILCSPHNPVCRVWTAEELQHLGQICAKHGVKVISDEIHCDFTFPGHPHTPFVKACPEMLEQTIICTAPSKSFNLAGLQVSNIFVPGAVLREKFQEEMTRISYSQVNCLGAVACKAAYTGAEGWLEECKAYMRENLAYVRSFLAEHLPQIRLVEPEGTYFAWLDCTDLGMTKEELDDVIINKAKLWLDSGAIFGESAALFQRVVLACPRETVEKAMESLAKAING